MSLLLLYFKYSSGIHSFWSVSSNINSPSYCLGIILTKAIYEWISIVTWLRWSLSGFILTSAHAWAKFSTAVITLMHLHDLEWTVFCLGELERIKWKKYYCLEWLYVYLCTGGLSRVLEKRASGKKSLRWYKYCKCSVLCQKGRTVKQSNWLWCNVSSGPKLDLRSIRGEVKKKELGTR